MELMLARPFPMDLARATLKEFLKSITILMTIFILVLLVEV